MAVCYKTSLTAALPLKSREPDWAALHKPCRSTLILIGVHTQAKLEREVLGGVAQSVSEEAKILVLIVPTKSKKTGFEARWASVVMQP